MSAMNQNLPNYAPFRLIYGSDTILNIHPEINTHPADPSSLPKPTPSNKTRTEEKEEEKSSSRRRRNARDREGWMDV